MSLGTEVGIRPVDLVLDGDTAAHGKGHSNPPPLLTHVYCGQTAGWIRVPLVTEVGLDPGDFVSDGELGTQLPHDLL